MKLRASALMLLVLVIALATSAASASAATCTWNGSTADWQTIGDWDCGHVPTSSDDVVISSGAPDVTSADASARLLNLSAGSLTVEATRTLAVSANGTSSIASGMTLKGTLTLGDATTWSAGTISLLNLGTINANSTFSITAALSMNAGTTNSAEQPQFNIGAAGAVVSDPGSGNTVVINPKLDNEATGTTPPGVEVKTGTLDLGDGAVASQVGHFVIDSGATLETSRDFESPSVTGAGTFYDQSGTTTVGSTDAFSPGTLKVGGTVTLNKSISIVNFVGANGARDGTGTLTVTGSLDFGASSFSLNAGTTTVANTVTSVAIIGQLNMNDATLNLNVPTTWSAGSIILLNNARFNVNSTFTISASDSMNAGTTEVGTNPLFNVGAAGSVVSDPGANGTVVINPLLDNERTGTSPPGVEVKSGTLFLGDGAVGSQVGHFVIDSGATLQTDRDFEAPSITGAGTFYVSNGTLTVGSTDAFSPGTLKVGGTASLNKDLSIANFVGANGARNGTGTLTVTGSVNFGASSFSLAGTTTIASSVTSVAIIGQLVIQNGILNLNAPTTWSAGEISMLDDATINVGSTFSIPNDVSMNAGSNLQGKQQLLHVGAAGTLTTSNSNTAVINAKITNGGAIAVTSGTLLGNAGLVQAGGTTTVASGATLSDPVTLNGGTLKGGGTVGAAVTNTGGTVAPGSSPGTLTVTGDYSQGSGGTLSEDIVGTTPGTGFDQLVVGGNVSLGGTLAIHSSSFTPSASDTFRIISATSSPSGAFAHVTGATVNGMTYSPQNDAQGVKLTVSGSLPPPAPKNTVAPSISGPGSPAPGNTLTCQNGSWSPAPTSFSYQWKRNGSPIAGATQQHYLVQVADEALTLTCTVVASNGASRSAPATSAGRLVGNKKALSCPKPSGKLSGTHLGPLALGMTRAQAEHAASHHSILSNGFENFCLFAGFGIRVNFPTAKLLKTLAPHQRSALAGRIVIMLTGNGHYALDGVKPGSHLSAVAKRLHVGKPFHIGPNFFYVAPGPSANGLVKVRGDIIYEVGLANKQLTSTPAAQLRFLKSFK